MLNAKHSHFKRFKGKQTSTPLHSGKENFIPSFEDLSDFGVPARNVNISSSIELSGIPRFKSKKRIKNKTSNKNLQRRRGKKITGKSVNSKQRTILHKSKIGMQNSSNMCGYLNHPGRGALKDVKNKIHLNLTSDIRSLECRKNKLLTISSGCKSNCCSKGSIKRTSSSLALSLRMSESLSDVFDSYETIDGSLVDSDIITGNSLSPVSFRENESVRKYAGQSCEIKVIDENTSAKLLLDNRKENVLSDSKGNQGKVTETASNEYELHEPLVGLARTKVTANGSVSGYSTDANVSDKIDPTDSGNSTSSSSDTKCSSSGAASIKKGSNRFLADSTNAVDLEFEATIKKRVKRQNLKTPGTLKEDRDKSDMLTRPTEVFKKPSTIRQCKGKENSKRQLSEGITAYPSSSTPFDSPVVKVPTLPPLFRNISPVASDVRLNYVIDDSLTTRINATKTYAKDVNIHSNEEDKWENFSKCSKWSLEMKGNAEAGESSSSFSGSDRSGSILFKTPTCSRKNIEIDDIYKISCQSVIKNTSAKNVKNRSTAFKRRKKRESLRLATLQKLANHFRDISEFALETEKVESKRDFNLNVF